MIRDARVQAAVPKLMDSMTFEPGGKTGQFQNTIDLLAGVCPPLITLSSRLNLYIWDHFFNRRLWLTHGCSGSNKLSSALRDILGLNVKYAVSAIYPTYC